MFYFSYHKSSERNEGVTFVFCADFFKSCSEITVETESEINFDFFVHFSAT